MVFAGQGNREEPRGSRARCQSLWDPFLLAGRGPDEEKISGEKIQVVNY